MYCHESHIRVRYGETDRMGYLYCGHYPEYFEVARTDMIRSLGISYREMEDQGILLPVRSLHIDYRQPALYDDLLVVRSCLKSLPETRLDIDYEIYNEQDVLVCTGNSVLVFVDAQSRKPRRAPVSFLDAVKEHFVS